MAQDEYTIKIDIKASKEKVWNVLTDFSSYDQWNTVLVMSNNDTLEIDREFNVTIIDNKGKESKFKARTLTKDPYNSFSARQVILGKWFFSATHHFIVEQKNDSETTFIQTWYFSGILFKPLKRMIFKQLSLFNRMNTDLKNFIEH